MDAAPPLAWQGARRLLPGCTASLIMHVGAGLSGSGSCNCAAIELYLEIPVINEAGAAFCMEETDAEGSILMSYPPSLY